MAGRAVVNITLNWKNEVGLVNRYGITVAPGGKHMQEKTHVSHSMESHPHEDLEGFDTLTELALDMRSSWSHGADSIWRQFNPELWDLTHNP